MPLVFVAMSLLLPFPIAAAPEQKPLGLGSFDSQPTTNGILIVAPHGTYDERSAELAMATAQRLDAGYVVARRFTVGGKRINVNRPTEGAGVSCANEEQTPRAREVYQQFLRQMQKAAGGRPLRLYIEIHGHSNILSYSTIEVASQGVSRAEAQRIKSAFPRLIKHERRAAPRYPFLALHIEPLDKVFFSAACDKTIGAMASDSVSAALHFELPRSARRPENIESSAALIAGLVRAYLNQPEDMPHD